MHDTNQHEFKMDGQDKGRGPRGVFQEAMQAMACESKLDFIPMQIEDSKSLAQSGHAQRMKMLMPSRY